MGESSRVPSYFVCLEVGVGEREHRVLETVMARLVEHPADDVIGRRAIDFVDTDDHDAIVQRTADVVERDARPPLRTTRCVRADGAVVEIETRAARIDFERRRAVEVTMRDVGERRARERAVALSEQRLRILLQSMEEGVVLQDESMNIVLWNAAAERILGLSGDQLAGRTSYDPAWAATDEFGDALPGDRHIAAVAMRTGRPASGVMGLGIKIAHFAQ